MPGPETTIYSKLAGSHIEDQVNRHLNRLVDVRQLPADALPRVVVQAVNGGKAFRTGIAYTVNGETHLKLFGAAVRGTLSGNSDADYAFFESIARQQVPSVLAHLEFSEGSLFPGHNPNVAANHRIAAVATVGLLAKAQLASNIDRPDLHVAAVKRLASLGETPQAVLHRPHHTTAAHWQASVSTQFEQTGGIAVDDVILSRTNQPFLALLDTTLAPSMPRSGDTTHVITPDRSAENPALVLAVDAMADVTTQLGVRVTPRELVQKSAEILDTGSASLANSVDVRELGGAVTGQATKKLY